MGAFSKDPWVPSPIQIVVNVLARLHVGFFLPHALQCETCLVDRVLLAEVTENPIEPAAIQVRLNIVRDDGSLDRAGHLTAILNSLLRFRNTYLLCPVFEHLFLFFESLFILDFLCFPFLPTLFTNLRHLFLRKSRYSRHYFFLYHLLLRPRLLRARSLHRGFSLRSGVLFFFVISSNSNNGSSTCRCTRSCTNSLAGHRTTRLRSRSLHCLALSPALQFCEWEVFLRIFILLVIHRQQVTHACFRRGLGFLNSCNFWGLLKGFSLNRSRLGNSGAGGLNSPRSAFLHYLGLDRISNSSGLRLYFRRA
mmetsp:Transcript_1560/g.3315  ORF Transcript_1560/g.3315 Transcript_1560/m.3315 type:complete len:308 (-) Transcript_1560:607-1530(-)